MGLRVRRHVRDAGWRYSRAKTTTVGAEGSMPYRKAKLRASSCETPNATSPRMRMSSGVTSTLTSTRDALAVGASCSAVSFVRSERPSVVSAAAVKVWR